MPGQVRSGFVLLTYPGTDQGTDTIIVYSIFLVYTKMKETERHISHRILKERFSSNLARLFTRSSRLWTCRQFLPPRTHAHARKPVTIIIIKYLQYVARCVLCLLTVFPLFKFYQSSTYTYTKKKKARSILSLFTRIRVPVSLCLVLNALVLVSERALQGPLPKRISAPGSDLVSVLQSSLHLNPRIWVLLWSLSRTISWLP